jgi:hypothetical protein
MLIMYKVLQVLINTKDGINRVFIRIEEKYRFFLS